MHAPIITGSDAEGAGEMFRVSTLDAKNPPLNDAGEVDYTQDFLVRCADINIHCLLHDISIHSDINIHLP